MLRQGVWHGHMRCEKRLISLEACPTKAPEPLRGSYQSRTPAAHYYRLILSNRNATLKRYQSISVWITNSLVKCARDMGSGGKVAPLFLVKAMYVTDGHPLAEYRQLYVIST